MAMAKADPEREERRRQQKEIADSLKESGALDDIFARIDAGESLIRRRYGARLSRIWSAVLRQMKGRGLLFQCSTQLLMSRRSSATLRCVARRNFFVVNSENHRSTWLSHEL